MQERGRKDTHNTRHTATSLFLFTVPHPNIIPQVFPTLTNTHEALVLPLHTRKQVSLSYVTPREMLPPPPPNLFKHSSTSLATTHLRLRLPFPFRTQLTTRNMTLPFIINFLSPHRHQTRPAPTPSYTCHERILEKRWFFPLFPIF
jgi:hypothetical protein